MVTEWGYGSRSAATAAIDHAVAEIVTAAQARARHSVTRRRLPLDRLAQALPQEEMTEGDAVRRLVGDLPEDRVGERPSPERARQPGLGDDPPVM